MDGLGNIWFLEEVNLFEYFCPIKKADETYEKFPKRSYPKGAFIYFSDDSSDQVFFIHSGAVKIAGYTEGGGEVIKAVLHAGEVFGEMAMFGEARRTDYAKTMESTELCVLARDQVANLMTEVSDLRNFIMGLMGKRVVYTHQEIANYTGTSRQTVTTILNQLREENLIDFDRKAFLLKDQQGLKAEAGLM